MRCPHCKNSDPRLLERLARDLVRCDICSKAFRLTPRDVARGERAFDTREERKGER